MVPPAFVAKGALEPAIRRDDVSEEEREQVGQSLPAAGDVVGAEHALHEREWNGTGQQQGEGMAFHRPGDAIDESHPCGTPEREEQGEKRDREQQEHIEEPHVGRVELVTARPPRAAREDHARESRQVHEPEPEVSVGLMEAAVAHSLQVEHRRHKSDHPNHEGDEEPQDPFAKERSGRTGTQGVAHAHARDHEQQWHPPGRAPQHEYVERHAGSWVVHEPVADRGEHDGRVEDDQAGHDERPHEVELEPPLRRGGRGDRQAGCITRRRFRRSSHLPESTSSP